MRDLILIHRPKESKLGTLVVLKLGSNLFAALPLPVILVSNQEIILWKKEILKFLPIQLESVEFLAFQSLKNGFSIEECIDMIFLKYSKLFSRSTEAFAIDLEKKWDLKSDIGHFKVFFKTKGLDFKQTFNFLRQVLNHAKGKTFKMDRKNMISTIAEFQFQSVERLLYLFPNGQNLVDRQSFAKFFVKASAMSGIVELLLRLFLSIGLVFVFLKCSNLATKNFLTWVPSLNLKENVAFILGYFAYLLLFYRCVGAALLIFDPFLIFAMLSLILSYIRCCFGVLRTILQFAISLIWRELRKNKLILNCQEYPESSHFEVFANKSTNKKLLVAPICNALILILSLLGPAYLCLKAVELIASFCERSLLRFSELREPGLTRLFCRQKRMLISNPEQYRSVKISQIIEWNSYAAKRHQVFGNIPLSNSNRFV